MNKNIIIGIIIVLIIIIVAVVYNKKSAIAPAQMETTVDQTQNTVPPRNDAAVIPKEITVIYSDAGFNPNDIKINQGDTVVFQNTSSKAFWPAAGDHPEHLSYPEFDSKKAVTTGSSYSFTFDKAGTWTFHDHMKSSNGGTITVE